MSTGHPRTGLWAVSDPAGRLLAADPRLWRIVTAVHDAAVVAGDDGYTDPITGLFVMTEATLRRRGSCCGSACRHCPYGADEARL